MLKFQFTDNPQKTFWAMEKYFSIGRNSNNHLVVDAESVSGNHAKLLQREDSYVLKDMGSKNGTYVNGQRITQRSIVCGDRIRFGEVELDVVDPLTDQPNSYWSLIADSSWLSGQEFQLKFTPRLETLTIGRSSECDITIPGTHLSRRHAELSVISENAIALKDLGSANGTFVNDQPISHKEIKAGDRLRFDVYSFRLFGPGINLSKAATHSKSPELLEESQPIRPYPQKKWKTKPTSMGNRTEVNLYKRNWMPTLIALLVLGAFSAFVVYLATA